MKLGDEFNAEVVDAMIQLALQIGQGSESHAADTIITIGDYNNVMEQSRQLTNQPVPGHLESGRKIALVVHQTSGAVRLFKEGTIVFDLHQTVRRIRRANP